MKTDRDLQRDILDEIEWDPRVNGVDIGVVAQGGVVTLTGSVECYPEKLAAEKAALRVSGVKAVDNDIGVKLIGDQNRTDTDIARAAYNEIEWNVLLPNNLRVTVDNGWITLRGKVECQYQKDAADIAIRRLTGVKGIINKISITPRIAPSSVKEKIEAALERHAILDVRCIQVEAQEGKIILYGTVRSRAEKEEAGKAAWLTTGVTLVDNELSVL